MKKSRVAVFITALMLAFTSVAFASQAGNQHHKTPGVCTFQKFRPFASKVWSPTRWRRKEVPTATFNAYRKRLACAPPEHRKAMKGFWAKEKAAFDVHRKQRLFRKNVDRFKCGDSYWATPCTIPLHESGYGSGGSNLYGLKDAWDVQGCTEFAPIADVASKHDQDICAHRHYDEYGRGGWPAY